MRRTWNLTAAITALLVTGARPVSPGVVGRLSGEFYDSVVQRHDGHDASIRRFVSGVGGTTALAVDRK